MREIFLDVLNAGIAAGWIAAAITVLRLILKKVPGYIYCILWNIVLIRLILPVKGIFPRARFNFIPSDMTVFRGDGYVSDEEVYSYHPAGDSSGYGIPSLIFTENGNRCTFVRFSMDSDFITGSCYEENDVFILTDESSGNEYVFDIQGAGERKIYIFNEEESAPLAEYVVDSGPGDVDKVKVPDGAVFQRKWSNILDAE